MLESDDRSRQGALQASTEGFIEGLTDADTMDIN